MQEALASFLGSEFKHEHHVAWSIWCKAVEDLFIIGMEEGEKNMGSEDEN